MNTVFLNEKNVPSRNVTNSPLLSVLLSRVGRNLLPVCSNAADIPTFRERSPVGWSDLMLYMLHSLVRTVEVPDSTHRAVIATADAAS